MEVTDELPVELPTNDTNLTRLFYARGDCDRCGNRWRVFFIGSCESRR
jgi:hypothetical protein